MFCRTKALLTSADQNRSELQKQIEEMKVQVQLRQDKEAELLQYTGKLSDQNVNLQSQLTAAHMKVKFVLKKSFT